MKRLYIATWLALLACGAQQPELRQNERASNPAAPPPYPDRLHIGRPATNEEIARWDIDVRPDGQGLPAGGGTSAQGAAVYLAKCAACHGAAGEGVSVQGAAGEGVLVLGARLIGAPRDRFDFALSPEAENQKTIGNYWPYATTLFDYMRRAMPFNAPGSLTNDEVYAVAAYLLVKNGIIPETAVINATSLPLVRMPAQPRFVPDDRLSSKRVK